MKETLHHKGHRWTTEEIKALIELWDNKELTTLLK